ncbi:hypothetical protein GCM10017783_25010 [Deinococcus piscis]|uniref:PatA-like N-terminal domain-containing protein n=1 Tax=Deinococcus piscis TaxID=394230 RepID=A0ABQ3KE29_9DEIO|nr:DUF4388 domain-containing protein [Deinococcus piscis]GHG11674.1 hypothetical protein GCM10017783_25010 [Deinococcus piscis]
MKRIFVVMSDPARAALIGWLISAAGARPSLSEGALPALTELERSEVDAVICSEDVGDMTGEDFRNILRYEPATRLTPVYLITSQTGQQHAEPPNYNVEPATNTLDLVRMVLQQVGVPAGPALPCDSAPGDLRGQMGEVGLAELISWVAEMQLSGHWLIESQDRRGYLLMQGGDITYAEFGGHTGHAALLELLDRVGQDPDSRFRFCRAELPSGPPPRNIEERTERLLMEVTVDLDHRHAERAASA